MSRRTLRAVAALVVVAGCDAASPRGEVEVSLITAFEAEEGADGPLDGVLELRDGCLYVEDIQVGLAVLPHDTTWDASTSTVVHSSGRSVAVGERLSGTAEGHEIADLVPWFVSDAELARARDCAAATGVTFAWVIGYFEGHPATADG